MNITLYENVTKRINSTYRPTGGTQKDVKLKEPSDFLNPVFELNDMNWNFNYVYAFGMYYRITDRILLTNNIQEIHCKVDSLATGKDLINSYSCFVERAETGTQYLDDPCVSVVGKIIDKTERSKSLMLDLLHPTEPHFDVDGCFIIRVVAPPPASISSLGVSTGIVSYAIDKSELYKLLHYAFDDNNFSNILVDETIKAVFNPIDYLIDIKWVPIPATTISNNTTTDTIYLGWFTTDAVGYPIVTYTPPTYVLRDPVYEISFTITPPTHYNDFRLTSSRFTKAYIYIPGVGSVDIEPSKLLYDFKVTYQVDRITGDAFAMLYYGSIQNLGWVLLGKYSAQLSCKINLSQSSIDMQGVVANVVTGTQNAMVENFATAGFQLVDSINKFIHPSVKMIGENGSMGTLWDSLFDGIKFVVESYESCDQPNTCGKPLYKNRLLGDLSGFIKCGNASLSTPFLEPITEEINQLLNSGFYLE